MEENLMLLGTEGLIKKNEFVRIIIQCLYALGYAKSASTLEIESGIRCRSGEYELLQSQICSGGWDDCIRTLNSLEDLMDDRRNSALFLVYEQYLLEFLKQGDDSLALGILRREISTLGVDRGKLNRLASSILSFEQMEFGSFNDSIHESRKRLLMELEKLLPPPYVLPERRLENLVEAAVVSQIDRCVYHNSSNAASLYEDHCCSRDQIPTETIQILTDHRNEVWFVQFSHDGEYLASSSSDCTAIIWKVLEDGKATMMHILRSHKNPVSFLAWSPDDSKLLTCGNAEVVKLWDVETGTCKHTFGDHDFIVSSCAWFPDSKRLVCGSSHSEKGISMWDCDGTLLKMWKGMRMPKILDLAVTPDGEKLISVLSDKDIRILNLVTNAEQVISEEHPITSLSVCGRGEFFIVNLNSQEIHLWDIAGKFEKPLRFFGHKQHKYVIRSCFGGLNSRFIASGSENAQVYIWNTRNAHPIEVLIGHTMTVNSVSWNPQRPQVLASASDDHTVRIWAPSTFKKI